MAFYKYVAPTALAKILPNLLNQNPRRVADTELEQGGVGVDLKIVWQHRRVVPAAFADEFLQRQ